MSIEEEKGEYASVLSAHKYDFLTNWMYNLKQNKNRTF